MIYNIDVPPSHECRLTVEQLAQHFAEQKPAIPFAQLPNKEAMQLLTNTGFEGDKTRFQVWATTKLPNGAVIMILVADHCILDAEPVPAQVFEQMIQKPHAMKDVEVK